MMCPCPGGAGSRGSFCISDSPGFVPLSRRTLLLILVYSPPGQSINLGGDRFARRNLFFDSDQQSKEGASTHGGYEKTSRRHGRRWWAGQLLRRAASPR